MSFSRRFSPAEFQGLSDCITSFSFQIPLTVKTEILIHGGCYWWRDLLKFIYSWFYVDIVVWQGESACLLYSGWIKRRVPTLLNLSPPTSPLPPKTTTSLPRFHPLHRWANPLKRFVLYDGFIPKNLLAVFLRLFHICLRISNHLLFCRCLSFSAYFIVLPVGNNTLNFNEVYKTSPPQAL